MSTVKKWLCAVFASLFFLYPCVQCKVVYGLADTGEVAFVEQFCFTIPENSVGRIRSQTVVDAGDHNLLIFSNAEDLKQSVLEQAECADLQTEARVVEHLLLDGSLAAYDLNLTVDSNVAGRPVAAVVTRCGKKLSVEFRLEFTNPGGILRKHFSCETQGLLEIYLVIVPVVLGGAALTTLLWGVLPGKDEGPAAPLVAGAFLATAFCLGSLLLNFSHIFIFAFDGIGVTLFHLLALLGDFLFCTFLTIVSFGFAIGEGFRMPQTDRVTRTALLAPVAVGNSDRTVSTFDAPTTTSTRTTTSTNTHPIPSSLLGYPSSTSLNSEIQHNRKDARRLVAVVVCLMTLSLAAGLVRTESSPFLYSHLRHVLSIPYLTSRFVAGAFILQTAPQNGGLGPQRQFLVQLALVQSAWCFAAPVLVISSFFLVFIGNKIIELVVMMSNLLAVGFLLSNFSPSKQIAIFGVAGGAKKLRQSPVASPPNHRHVFPKASGIHSMMLHKLML